MADEREGRAGPGPRPANSTSLRESAESGDVEAMLRLARGLSKDNRVEALEWSKKAAELGEPEGMALYGWLLRYWERAADHGSTLAMLSLARVLLTADRTEALTWYERAADAGDPAAMYQLSTAIKDDDVARSHELLLAAGRAGYRRAVVALGQAAIDTNPEGARRWLEPLADKRDIEAMARMG